VSMCQCIFACVVTYAYGSVLYIDVALYLLCDVYMLLVYLYICVICYNSMYVCVWECARVSVCGVCLLINVSLFFL
jgi:hypothetical protein